MARKSNTTTRTKSKGRVRGDANTEQQPQPQVQQKVRVKSVLTGNTAGYNPNMAPREIEAKLLAYSYANPEAIVLPVLEPIVWATRLEDISKQLQGLLRSNGGQI